MENAGVVLGQYAYPGDLRYTQGCPCSSGRRELIATGNPRIGYGGERAGFADSLGHL